MKKKQDILPQDFYSKYLSSISDIHFTKREVDVIACLVNARKTSKTAFFLSIDPRTVETHVRNIMSKVGCNSRERIIDFIEISDKIQAVREYYSLLKMQALFEKSLKDISFLKPDKIFVCLLNNPKNKDSLIHHLAYHLRLAGIKASVSTRVKRANCGIYILSKSLKEEKICQFLQRVTQNISRVFCLLPAEENWTNIIQKLASSKKIDFVKQENYYFSFFAILKKTLENINLDKIIDEFKEQYNKIFHQDSLPQVNLNNKEIKKQFFFPLKSYFWAAFLVLGVINGGLLTFIWHKNNDKSLQFQSDLLIPKESVLLNRPKLISEIENKFKTQTGIQCVAIVGMGGAGKTTLARQYARSQKLSLVWELNAETKNNLLHSFENLAYALAKTEKDERILKELQEIKDIKEKERKLFLFIKQKFRNQPNWVLIYDNVETLTDIQKYLPSDSQEWGKGKIILTSRDRNIGDNSRVNQTIYMPELSEEEKENLFFKIMGKGNINQLAAIGFTKVKSFLSEIPPFPLDISAAAYYLKATNITYEEYTKRLSELNQNFIDTQEYLLKENSQYAKTRHSIIILSLKQLIQMNPEYKDILLLLCLLDSQNIPRDLLNKYKDEITIDNFIIHLKKYSLIEIKSSSFGGSTLSIHRSTQSIAFNYLLKALCLIDSKHVLNQIITCLEEYNNEAIRNDDLSRIKLLVAHTEALLRRDYLFDKIKSAKIRADLGYLHYLLGNFQTAQLLLTKNETILSTKKDKNSIAFARTLTYLGAIHWRIGNFGKSLDLLHKSESIYEKNNMKDYEGLSITLAYLGILYISKDQGRKAILSFEKALLINGKYLPDNHIEKAFVLSQSGFAYLEVNLERSKKYLEESIDIYKKYCSARHVRLAWSLSHLACYYRIIGEYQKAITLDEQVLSIYKDYYADNGLEVAWAMRNLGSSYRALGDFEKAKQLLEKSFIVFKKYLGEDNIKTKWVLFELGKVYKELGSLKKAKDAFKDCLGYFEKQNVSNNFRAAHVLRSLGQVFTLEGKLEEAQHHFEKALLIYLNGSKIFASWCYEDLAELYLKKSEISPQPQKGLLKEQAKIYLTKALEILEKYYPAESPHLARVKTKFDNMKE